MKKAVFITLGCLAVALGAIGAVTPVLPTTPFLLLATYLFSRSSDRLNRALLHNKIFGKFLTNYFENKPVPLREKIISISFLWAGLGATFYFARLTWYVTAILIVVGVSVTIHLMLLGRRRK